MLSIGHPHLEMLTQISLQFSFNPKCPLSKSTGSRASRRSLSNPFKKCHLRSFLMDIKYQASESWCFFALFLKDMFILCLWQMQVEKQTHSTYSIEPLKITLFLTVEGGQRGKAEESAHLIYFIRCLGLESHLKHLFQRRCLSS